MDFQERYGRLGSDPEFDRRFWQAQGPERIFQALEGMVRDYLVLREGNAHEPRLQRAVEAFRRR